MAHHHRVSLALSSLLLVVPLLFAQVRRPLPIAKEEPGFSLPVSDLGSHLEVAEEQIAKKDWPVATTLLLKLLDRQDDVFTSIKRQGKGVLVNVQTEAARLVRSMPKE